MTQREAVMKALYEYDKYIEANIPDDLKERLDWIAVDSLGTKVEIADELEKC
jgi:hypothetical protein